MRWDWASILAKTPNLPPFSFLSKTAIYGFGAYCLSQFSSAVFEHARKFLISDIFR